MAETACLEAEDIATARKRILKEIGERTCLLMDIDRGIKERSGLVRNVGRFIFRHGAWAEDQAWLHHRQGIPHTLETLNIVGHAILQDLTEGAVHYYDVTQELAGMGYIRARFMQSPELPES